MASRRKGSVNSRGSGTSSFNKFNPALNKELLERDKEESEKAMRDTEDQRAKAEEECDENANITWPKYEFDDVLAVDREVDIPPKELFLGLGWDEDSTTKRRHYRRYYNRELEKQKDVLPNESPFNQYDLKRGQSRGAKKSFFGTQKQDASGQVDTTQITGRFKAVI